MTVWSAERAVICLFSIRSWTFETSAGSLTIWRWPLKMSAAESPSSWATFWIRASRSAAGIHDGAVEPLDLRRGLVRMIEHLLLDRAEDRLHPMGDADHDTRTHADSFTHDYPVSGFEGGQTSRASRRRRDRLGRGKTALTPEAQGAPPESVPPTPGLRGLASGIPVRGRRRRRNSASKAWTEAERSANQLQFPYHFPGVRPLTPFVATIHWRQGISGPSPRPYLTRRDRRAVAPMGSRSDPQASWLTPAATATGWGGLPSFPRARSTTADRI